MAPNVLVGGKKVSCGSCVYIDKKNASDVFCRRYPATLIVMREKRDGDGKTIDRVRHFYPSVNPDLDWCGEYSVWPADSIQ